MNIFIRGHPAPGQLTDVHLNGHWTTAVLRWITKRPSYRERMTDPRAVAFLHCPRNGGGHAFVTILWRPPPPNDAIVHLTNAFCGGGFHKTSLTIWLPPAGLKWFVTGQRTRTSWEFTLWTRECVVYFIYHHPGTTATESDPTDNCPPTRVGD